VLNDVQDSGHGTVNNYPSICLEKLKKTTKTLSGIASAWADLNLEPSKRETAMLSPQPQHSV
jgi:hypothetical protein